MRHSERLHFRRGNKDDNFPYHFDKIFAYVTNYYIMRANIEKNDKNLLGFVYKFQTFVPLVTICFMLY